jgi:phosphohistidine phosphatase
MRSTGRTSRAGSRSAKEARSVGGVDLFVVRHAVAFERDSERWPDDCERPLTARGERAFRRAARGLGRVTEPVAKVLSSPCVRAWRTAELLAEDAGWPKPEPLDALRPEGDVASAIAALAASRGAERLAIVGHDPLLSDLCGALAGSASVELKKGAVARLTVRRWRSGGATLRWLLPPKVLRALWK